MAVLELTNLCKKFGRFALGPVDLTLEPGTANGLIGANGAGKTTLFRCIMGTVRRSQGIVRVEGAVADDSDGHWKEKIGYVGDYTPLFDRWSGGDNLQAVAACYDSWSDETVQRLASRLDLDLDQTAKHYSTGQRTKLALIRALAHGAKVLLLDEPTAGLDPVARDTFMEILHERMLDDDVTVLYATHHVAEIESFVDQLVFIDHGRILRREMKEDLAQHWRKVTFRFDPEVGEIPNEISRRVVGSDCEIVSSNYQSSIWFLEQAGIRPVQESRISIEQICVQLLKTRRGV